MNYNDLEPGEYYKPTFSPDSIWYCGYRNSHEDKFLVSMKDGSTFCGDSLIENVSYMSCCDKDGNPIQPEPAADQIWEDSDGDKFIIKTYRGFDGDNMYLRVFEITAYDPVKYEILNDCVKDCKYIGKYPA